MKNSGITPEMIDERCGFPDDEHDLAPFSVCIREPEKLRSSHVIKIANFLRIGDLGTKLGLNKITENNGLYSYYFGGTSTVVGQIEAQINFFKFVLEQLDVSQEPMTLAL